MPGTGWTVRLTFLLMEYAWSVFSRLPRRLKHSTAKSEILPGKHCECPQRGRGLLQRAPVQSCLWWGGPAHSFPLGGGQRDASQCPHPSGSQVPPGGLIEGACRLLPWWGAERQWDLGQESLAGEGLGHPGLPSEAAENVIRESYCWSHSDLTSTLSGA